jgi:hypothetical protein
MPASRDIDWRRGVKNPYPVHTEQRAQRLEAQKVLDAAPLTPGEVQKVEKEMAARKRQIQMYPLDAKRILEKPYPDDVQAILDRAKSFAQEQQAFLEAAARGERTAVVEPAITPAPPAPATGG